MMYTNMYVHRRVLVFKKRGILQNQNSHFAIETDYCSFHQRWWRPTPWRYDGCQLSKCVTFILPLIFLKPQLRQHIWAHKDDDAMTVSEIEYIFLLSCGRPIQLYVTTVIRVDITKFLKTWVNRWSMMHYFCPWLYKIYG